MKNKTIKIKLPKWAIEKLDYLLKSDYCQDRGFEMTYSDLIAEMIANFRNKEISNEINIIIKDED